jgi:hypothetical protein
MTGKYVDALSKGTCVKPAEDPARARRSVRSSISLSSNSCCSAKHPSKKCQQIPDITAHKAKLTQEGSVLFTGPRRASSCLCANRASFSIRITYNGHELLTLRHLLLHGVARCTCAIECVDEGTPSAMEKPDGVGICSSSAVFLSVAVTRTRFRRLWSLRNTLNHGAVAVIIIAETRAYRCEV